MLRAKFQVKKRSEVFGANSVEITLAAQFDDTIPEDQRFAALDPAGDIVLYVERPEMLAQLEMGKFFYVDFSKAD